MPYSGNDQLPPAVKKKSLAKQTAFREAFNSAHESGKDEATCFKIAWSAANGAGDDIQNKLKERLG